ncbi:rod shape-determining protein MreC [Psittacicella gerlachiana]|uniref:Cell shape-determining protein MreC n=1 Tax=Psittacicella gerlachiana TaxID=2028574 RepID=A0A3A1Y790_9GAMM|nr:rod shape-determining protein MreC [Psittacicella gerlachiana]RIY33176.1 rod shape-determining protein MreC [Psittacicella gerlachiana]
MNNAIFYKPKHLWRAIVCMLIAITLFCLSVTKSIEPFRTYLDNLTNRIFIINYGTNQIVNHISPNFKDVGALTTANEQLQRQVAELKSQLSRLQALQVENEQLKSLFGINNPEVARTLAVNIINTEQGVKNNIIFIDRGAEDGIFYGQNIFDSLGLIGQIISVSDRQSRVLMITDINSYVPVYNLNNQEQYLLKGTNSNELLVEYVRGNSEIKVGDLLYTSGLANRFISNYPVAKIIKVTKDNNGNVIRAYATPLAQLNSLRYMVAAWPYCQVLPDNVSANLVYQRRYLSQVLERVNKNRKAKSFLDYQYKGIDPKTLTFARYLENIKHVTMVTSLSYSGDVNLGHQNCYVINPERKLENNGGTN